MVFCSNTSKPVRLRVVCLWLLALCRSSRLARTCLRQSASAGQALALPRRMWLLALLALCPSGLGQVVINEVLINPPGTDSPNEYIELRGAPNQLLPAGSYFVVVEGDVNGN